MTTCIGHKGSLYYVERDIAEVCKALNDGVALRTWWYTTYGERCEEDTVFYGDPDFVRTERDARFAGHPLA